MNFNIHNKSVLICLVFYFFGWIKTVEVLYCCSTLLRTAARVSLASLLTPTSVVLSITPTLLIALCRQLGSIVVRPHTFGAQVASSIPSQYPIRVLPRSPMPKHQTLEWHGYVCSLDTTHFTACCALYDYVCDQ